MDTVTSKELYGFSASNFVAGHDDKVDQVVIPENSALIDFKYPGHNQASVIVPKYNNYLRNQQSWAHENTIRIPLQLLDIPDIKKEETITTSSLGNTNGVVSYVIFKTLGDLLPSAYSGNVEQRWGVGLAVKSPVFTLAVHTSKDGLVHGKMKKSVRLRFRVPQVGRKANPQCVTWMNNRE